LNRPPFLFTLVNLLEADGTSNFKQMALKT
jgi:hypothetical protein